MGFYVLVFVLSLGPLGLFVAVFLGLAAMATRSWLGDEERDDVAARRTSCPACGAPNPVEAATCGYCDEPLAGT